MRKPLTFAACVWACLASAAFSQMASLSNEEATAYAKNLKAMQEMSSDQRTQHVKAGIAALAAVVNDGDAAAKLYEKCYKKAEFDDKSTDEWRQWKEKFEDPKHFKAYKKTLCHEIRWALLCLEASLNAEIKTKTKTVFSAEGAEGQFSFGSYDASTSEAASFQIIHSDGTTENVPMKWVQRTSPSVELAPEKNSEYTQRAIKIFVDYVNDGEVNPHFSCPIIDGPIGKCYQLEGLTPSDWPSGIQGYGFQRAVETFLKKPAREKKDILAFRKASDLSVSLSKKTLQKQIDNKIGAYNPSEIADMMIMIEMRGEEECFHMGDQIDSINNMLKMLPTIKNKEQKGYYVDRMISLLSPKDSNEERIRL